MANKSMEFEATLFTGVRGIGNSLFLIYFIYRLLSDARFPDKRFVLEFKKGVYLCFQPTSFKGEFLCTVIQSMENIMPWMKCLLLCDIDGAVSPSCRAKWTLIFSSPNAARYKEILKNAPNCQYAMPTWSEQELLCLNADIHLWYDDFVLFGDSYQRSTH